MESRKYIDKIKKLLALSKSLNEHETKLALACTQKLMREHALTDSDVIINTFESKGAHSNAEKVPRYMNMLASVVATGFGCDCIYVYKWTNSFNQKCVVRFIGTAERPKIAAYAFDILRRQLVLARNVYLKKNKRIVRVNRTARVDLFCESWVYGARDKLQDFNIAESEKTLIRNFIKNKNYRETQVRNAKECCGNHSARTDGYTAGQAAKLNHGVNGTETKKLGWT